jgi:hypothetical protein
MGIEEKQNEKSAPKNHLIFILAGRLRLRSFSEFGPQAARHLFAFAICIPLPPSSLPSLTIYICRRPNSLIQ